MPKEKKCQWTCTNCGAVIEARQKEGKVVCDQRDGNYVTFRCPECRTENHVDITLFI